MSLLFVSAPVKSPPRRAGRWPWWLLLGLGLIVIGHGCHSGDHDIDDEPTVTHPADRETEGPAVIPLPPARERHPATDRPAGSTRSAS